MNFTKFVFPSPKPTYDLHTPNLIAFPRLPIEELIQNMARTPLTLPEGIPHFPINKSCYPLYLLPLYRILWPVINLFPRKCWGCLFSWGYSLFFKRTAKKSCISSRIPWIWNIQRIPDWRDNLCRCFADIQPFDNYFGDFWKKYTFTWEIYGLWAIDISIISQKSRQFDLDFAIHFHPECCKRLGWDLGKNSQRAV